MSEIRICKYCGMELLEDVPHGLRDCHLHAVARIAELEEFINQLIEVGDWLNAMHEDGVFVDELNAARTSWKLAVSDWQAMPSHVTNPLDSQGIVTRNGGEG